MPGAGLGRRRPRRHTEHYTSSESTKTIEAGTPVCFTLSGTDDGGLVENPSSSPSVAVGTQLLAGVSTREYEAGETGEFVVYGFVNKLRLVRGTRAASTDSYASSPAIAVGDHMNLETVADGVSRATAAASGVLHPFVALETKASSASGASTTSDTSTARTDTIKAFVRLMG